MAFLQDLLKNYGSAAGLAATLPIILQLLSGKGKTSSDELLKYIEKHKQITDGRPLDPYLIDLYRRSVFKEITRIDVKLEHQDNLMRFKEEELQDKFSWNELARLQRFMAYAGEGVQLNMGRGTQWSFLIRFAFLALFLWMLFESFASLIAHGISWDFKRQVIQLIIIAFCLIGVGFWTRLCLPIITFFQIKKQLQESELAHRIVKK